MSLQEINSKL
jgi:hypothetical protein